MLAAKVRYTFSDLLEQESSDEHIYDILGGELVVWTSPSPRHAATVTNVMEFLLGARRAGHGEVLTAPCAVAFDYAERGVQSEDVTHPDVLFVRQRRHDVFGEWCLVAAPDLVVEVLSPSTRGDDLPGGRKFAIYERYGVTYYWVVDAEARTIAQYTLQSGRYGQPLVLAAGAGATLACPLFPGITCPVEQIFAGIL